MNIVVPPKAPPRFDHSMDFKYIYDRAINNGFALDDLVDTTSFWTRLREHYDQPVAMGADSVPIPRNYHNFDHIRDGVDALRKIEPHCECLVNSVLVAWLYHDAYYRVGDKSFDNERASADLALIDLLQMGWAGERAGRVWDLVMYTKHKYNPPADDYEGQLIVDIDLLGLASTPVEKFFENTRKVRDEFKNFTDEQFATGRLHFWEGFLELKKNRIFRTSHFEHLNDIALDNIHKEQFSLQRQRFV
jgi:predicted metal-dependent HD superfamily phosphohydrolase